MFLSIQISIEFRTVPPFVGLGVSSDLVSGPAHGGYEATLALFSPFKYGHCPCLRTPSTSTRQHCLSFLDMLTSLPQTSLYRLTYLILSKSEHIPLLYTNPLHFQTYGFP